MIESKFRVVALAACIVAAGMGCDEAVYQGTPVPNSPPDTEITSTPPSLERTDFRVHFNWNGDDRDGEVIGFEWRISNNGLDGIIDVADTLESVLPWQFTTALDSVFEVEANLDSFYADLDNPDVNPDDYRSWQTHTLFIRSIDDDGARDPTPAMSSFTTTTLTPTVRITIPRLRTNSSCTASASVLTFGWKATDPDGERTAPAATRYILLPYAADFCLTEAEFSASDVIPHEDPAWSEWAPYDPDDPSTHTVTFPRADVGKMFLFAVQARDVAGATTANFEWNENVRHVRVSSSKLPALESHDPILGDFNFVGVNGLRSFEIIGGMPIRTSWSADATEYAGVIDAYRWGWDVNDPDDSDDPGWAVQWGDTPAHRTVGNTSFPDGVHRLVFACRDNSGTVSRATFVLSVIPVPEREFQRQLLIVEDLPIGGEPVSEALERRWQQQLIDLADEKLRYFVPGDLIDADQEPNRITFQELVRYQAVIWMASGSTETFYQKNFTGSGGIFGGGSGETGVHWLEIYQQRAGNLLYMGSAAARGTIAGAFSTREFPLRYDDSQRWMYRAFCVEISDFVRPSLGSIVGEQITRPIRSIECDAIAEAVVSQQYIDQFPEAITRLSTLVSTQARVDLERVWSFTSDEFYNYNGTRRNVRLFLRECQIPFLELRTRRDLGVLTIPESDCVPVGSEESIIEGAPIAIASRAHSATKPLAGSEDYVMGFNPFSFRTKEVQQLFRYIFESRWDMEMF